MKILKSIFNKMRLVLNQDVKEQSGRQILLSKLPVNSIGAEIGVHLGDFSQVLVDTLSPKELILIDPWEHQTSEKYQEAWYGGAAKDGQNEMDARYTSIFERFNKQIDAGSVKVKRGYSENILKEYPDEYFDWVYIDGNHLYEYVKQDLLLSLDKVKVGGFITGDDYTKGGWWKGGVKKAVDEFTENTAVELIEIRDRQFIFRKNM